MLCASLVAKASIFLAVHSPATVVAFAPSILRPSFSWRAKRTVPCTLLASNREDEEEDYYDFGEPVQLPPGLEQDLKEEDLVGLTVDQLKQQLRLKGLKVGGRKKDLIDRLLAGHPLESGVSTPGGTEKSKAWKFAEDKGKELVDVSEYLEEDDQGKQVKTWNKNEAVDVEFEKEDTGEGSGKENSDNKAEVWGSEARIVDDFEGRRVVVDSLSQLVVEFKGSNQSYVSAYVVASRDALKPFLAGGEKSQNQTQAEQRVREIQTKREQAHRTPIKADDFGGSDEGDPRGLYADAMLARDYSDWGKYTITGAQLSAAEVQGVLLLSDVYGAFAADTQALAEKIAFECQPVVVMVPDLFRGYPWKESKSTLGKNERGQTYEEWRATHSDLRVSIDIRAAAACLREAYGVSSVVVWGTCYGGGRALEAAAGYIPDGKVHDVDGSVGPDMVNPMAAVAWYPTRYNAGALFGKDRIVGAKIIPNAPDFAVMAVFGGKDTLPGATSDDAHNLKALLDEDERVKDSLIKIFPDQDHGFAHIGLSAKTSADSDTEFERFVDEEFGGSGRVTLDDGEADVACLLSTAFMETYSRVFLPTAGAPIRNEDGDWSSVEMKSLSDANTRDIRQEIEESLDACLDQPLDDESAQKELEA